MENPPPLTITQDGPNLTLTLRSEAEATELREVLEAQMPMLTMMLASREQ